MGETQGRKAIHPFRMQNSVVLLRRKISPPAMAGVAMNTWSVIVYVARTSNVPPIMRTMTSSFSLAM